MKKQPLQIHPLVMDNIRQFSAYQKENKRKVPNEWDKFKEWRRENRSRMTAKDKYMADVFLRITNLLRMFNRLNYSQVLMARSPKVYNTSTNKFGRNDWTEYHFFVFSTSLASILDCSILLTAEIYQLGLPPRYCKFDTIVNHNWLNGSAIARLLKKLRKYLESHSERRNRYLHRGEESDFSEITDYESILRLRSITTIMESDINLDDKLNISPRKLSYMWKLATSEAVQKCEEIEYEVGAIVIKVFDALYPRYKKYFESYK